MEVKENQHFVGRHVDHPHRLLEWATTGISHCSSCKNAIPQGALRFGVKIEVHEHEGVQWRHLHCVTEQQAVNFKLLAMKENKDLAEILTRSPNMPEKIVKQFCDLILALADEDHTKSKGLLRRLEKLRIDDAGVTKKELTAADTHALDEQIRNDNDLKNGVMTLLGKDDLRAVCIHNKLSDEGGKDELKKRLHDFYASGKDKSSSDHVKSEDTNGEKKHATGNGADHNQKQGKRDTAKKEQNEDEESSEKKSEGAHTKRSRDGEEQEDKGGEDEKPMNGNKPKTKKGGAKISNKAEEEGNKQNGDTKEEGNGESGEKRKREKGAATEKKARGRPKRAK